MRKKADYLIMVYVVKYLPCLMGAVVQTHQSWSAGIRLSEQEHRKYTVLTLLFISLLITLILCEKLTLLRGLAFEDKSMMDCWDTALWLMSDLWGDCPEVLGASYSLAVEDCTAARGAECMAVPLVCCNDCSGAPLPTGPGVESGFSLFRRSVWLSGLVALGTEKDKGIRVRVKVGVGWV